MSNFTQPQTYIKISKIDSNGKDNTSALSQLQTITVPFSDGSKAVYEVLGTTQYIKYFSYVVKFIDASSLYTQDFGKPEYKFTGSLSTDFISIPASPNYVTHFRSRNTPIISFSNDNLGLYDPSTQTYDLDTYPQKDITIRATGQINTSVIGGYTGLKLAIYIIPPTIQNPDGSGNPYVFAESPSFSLYSPNPSSFDFSYTAPIESITPGSKIEVRGIAGANPTTLKLNSGNLFISSTSATGNTVSTVLEPNFEYKFTNSGCDVLLGEVQKSRPNKYLQDLDYNTSQTKPVNYQAILNNTAVKATVPFSNYTQKASINSRYVGTKNQSSNFNLYIPSAGTSSFGTPINIGTYGAVPSITNSSTSLIYFKGFTSSSNEQSFQLSYIISQDEELTEILPSSPIIKQLGQIFSPIPFPETINGSSGGPITFKAISFAPNKPFTATYTGISEIIEENDKIILKVYNYNNTTFLPAEVTTQDGIVFPSSIEFSQFSDLPSKAKEILSTNNII